MHALADVDDLRNAAIADDRGEGVGFLAAHRHDGLFREPIDRLIDRYFHGLIQVFVKAHEDPIGFRFRPGPFCLHVLAHDGLDFDFLVRTFQRGQVDLAVALPAVRIAGPDQASFLKHRKVHGCARLKFIHIHVGAVFPRAQRAGASFRIADRRSGFGVRFIRVDADREGTGKGLQVNDDSRFELRLHFRQVELVVANEAFREFGRQLPDGGKLLPRYVEIETVFLGHDFQNMNFQGIAGFGALDENGSRDRVRSAARIGFTQPHDFIHWNPGLDLSQGVRQGFNGDGVP